MNRSSLTRNGALVTSTTSGRSSKKMTRKMDLKNNWLESMHTGSISGCIPFLKVTFRQLIEAIGCESNICELDIFQLQLFVEEIINTFLTFFKRMKLSDEDITKGRAAFRMFISAWQYDYEKLGEFMSKSYLSAVMKICCTSMPASKPKNLYIFF